MYTVQGDTPAANTHTHTHSRTTLGTQHNTQKPPTRHTAWSVGSDDDFLFICVWTSALAGCAAAASAAAASKWRPCMLKHPLWCHSHGLQQARGGRKLWLGVLYSSLKMQRQLLSCWTAPQPWQQPKLDPLSACARCLCCMWSRCLCTAHTLTHTHKASTTMFMGCFIYF